MKDRGVKLIYGRWLIEGAPRVLLFDTGSCYDRYAHFDINISSSSIFHVLSHHSQSTALTSRMDEWKADLWNLAGIPSPPNDHETNEAIVFGYIVAWFLGEVSLIPLPHPPTYLHMIHADISSRPENPKQQS
jgi:glycogen(starch) synthase